VLTELSSGSVGQTRTGVILRDFSPEGSRAHHPNDARVDIRCALDPSQAQDDAIMR
jgi:hypothetical protein